MTDLAPNRDRYLRLARAELAQARANRCTHGVNRSRAVCRVCAQPTDEPAVAGEETSDE